MATNAAGRSLAASELRSAVPDHLNGCTRGVGGTFDFLYVLSWRV
jgi:hypothetical protein